MNKQSDSSATESSEKHEEVVDTTEKGDNIDVQSNDVDKSQDNIEDGNSEGEEDMKD